MQARARELVDRLGLEPHPEGGFYREIFRSAHRVQTERGDDRCGLTSIYFLLAAGQVSRWHAVASDEAWHFYEGEPLELFVHVPGTAEVRRHVLGPAVDGQQTPVAVVPAAAWQAARPLGAFSLVGCSVGPGFEFADFRFVADLEPTRRAFDEVDALGATRDLL